MDALAPASARRFGLDLTVELGERTNRSAKALTSTLPTQQGQTLVEAEAKLLERRSCRRL